MPRSAATISITCGVAPSSAKPREKLYASSSSTMAIQSLPNCSWSRHGRSIRHATVAVHSHRNARIGSVRGSPSPNHQAVKLTAQMLIATGRRRQRGVGSGAKRVGAGASSEWRVSVIAHKVNGVGPAALYQRRWELARN